MTRAAAAAAANPAASPASTANTGTKIVWIVLGSLVVIGLIAAAIPALLRVRKRKRRIRDARRRWA